MSNKDEKLPESELPDQLDYSEIDEEELFEDSETESVKRKATVTKSGRQKSIGIPADIEDTLNIAQGDQITFVARPDPKNPERDKLYIIYDKFNDKEKTNFENTV